MALPFENRAQAGRILAAQLAEYRGRPEVLVLGLPRGGVPVAFEVAQALGVPLDVFLVRKLGVPGHAELAMGAIASGGVRVVNQAMLRSLRISPQQLDAVIRAEEAELRRQERVYRGDRPPPDVSGRTAILVDDGLATGATMQAAVAALRSAGPKEVVVAVPVAPPETCAELEVEADRVVCALTPEPFYAVGAWYRDFSQTSDDEVRELLRRNQAVRAAS
ncbi:MAG TPA: phosphoribosyltransferase [Candidatus Eisenbacteria bacterium]|nr:phosphoribosyltransferase [Candidatus Eisenbacteria bacterium]